MSPDESVVITRPVDPTSLTNSTIAFLTAFGLEALLFSSELWARLPVGVVLTVIVMLISWCVWTTLEAKSDFSVLVRVHDLKDGLVDFTRRLRGKISGPVSDAGDVGGGAGQGRIRRLSRSETFKEAFNKLRPRRPRASTSATLVDSAGINGFRPRDATSLEMAKIKNDASGSAV